MTATSSADLCAEALRALQAAGLPFETLEPDTGFRRHPSREHSRLWYIANSGTGRSGRPYLQVSAGDPRLTGGVETASFSWSSWRDSARGNGLDHEELAEIRADIEAKTLAAKARREREREETAVKARWLWVSAGDASQHPYLIAKRVGSHGLRVADGLLLVPVRDAAGKLHGLQRIGPDGDKRFTPGSTIAGHFHLIGEPSEGKPLYLAEGYATAATIHEATDAAVAVAFNCGNLLPVAKALRATYPAAAMIVAGDNDAWTDGNPGVRHAREAASAAGAALAIPNFEGFDQADHPTDFNDLARLGGAEAVRVQLAPPPGPVEIIVSAIARQADDRGACFTSEAISAWRKIQEADRAEFERLREQAGKAGARRTEIDAAVKWREPRVVASAALRHTGWQADLIYTRGPNDSIVYPYRIHNLLLCLRHAPEFEGRLKWNSVTEVAELDGHPLDDTAVSLLQASMEKCWISGSVHSAGMTAAILAIAHESPYNPIVDYLDSLAWDGMARVESFFSQYCLSLKTDYHEGVARAFFVGAVRRARHPGCQVDTMPILIGRQGIGKTRLWQTLFGRWYAEITDSIESKDFFLGLRGRWCCDFGELDQFSKADVSRIKQILTIREDHYRAPYGRFAETHPRRNVFVGGTNAITPLRDASGGRRFLPVHVPGEIDLDGISRDRDQLWAEASEIAKDPGRWWDVRGAEEEQEKVFDVDSWEEPISAWLDGLPTKRATTTDVLREALHIEVGRHDRSAQTRVGQILRRLGWRAKKEAIGAKREYVYRPTK